MSSSDVCQRMSSGCPRSCFDGGGQGSWRRGRRAGGSWPLLGGHGSPWQPCHPRWSYTDSSGPRGRWCGGGLMQRQGRTKGSISLDDYYAPWSSRWGQSGGLFNASHANSLFKEKAFSREEGRHTPPLLTHLTPSLLLFPFFSSPLSLGRVSSYMEDRRSKDLRGGFNPHRDAHPPPRQSMTGWSPAGCGPPAPPTTTRAGRYLTDLMAQASTTEDLLALVITRPHPPPHSSLSAVTALWSHSPDGSIGCPGRCRSKTGRGPPRPCWEPSTPADPHHSSPVVAAIMKTVVTLAGAGV